MKFNASKSKMEVCCLKFSVSQLDITIQGEAIERFDTVKALGIYISKDLSRDNHVDHVHEKVVKTCWGIDRYTD